MTVHSETSCLMVACTVTSVSRSTAAVASSMVRTLVFLSRALAVSVFNLWYYIYYRGVNN